MINLNKIYHHQLILWSIIKIEKMSLFKQKRISTNILKLKSITKGLKWYA